MKRVWAAGAHSLCSIRFRMPFDVWHAILCESASRRTSASTASTASCTPLRRTARMAAWKGA